MKFLVREATLKTGYAFKGSPQNFIATGAEWPGWTIYVDTNARELVVDVPNRGTSERICVPLENVVGYKRGVVAPKETGLKPEAWASFEDK